MRFVFIVLTVLLFAGFSATGAAEAGADDSFVYKWTDAKGSTHISNSLKSVPGQYLKSVKKIKRIDINSPSKSVEPIFSSVEGEARVKFNLNDNAMIAPAVFNGSVKRNVLIDTGSELVTITTKLARALGYDYENMRKAWFQTQSGPILAPVIKIERLAMGGAQVTGLQAAVIDFKGRGPVSAVAGMNFLSAFIFEIDTQNRSLILTSPGN
ncbi:hypothetical protein MNBD_NITROSPINAE03-1612 [hydrothermal vent metagenome]|uniref:DUF4124 domain-containing protein n=1 Tax=hydrothermal vent metagenome TaxID=652676 RepID=A0A3B1D6F8_9ZZZZ